MSLWGHPIGGLLEDFWKAHADKHDDPKWIEFLATYKVLFDKKQLEQSSAHDNSVNGKKVFGMSGSGNCLKKATLKLLKYPEERQSGSSYFTFWLGHDVEIAALATLQTAGYPLIDTQKPLILETEINGVVTPIMKSASDGIIKLLGIETPVSVKSAAYKMSGKSKGKFTRRGFAEYPFSGTRYVNPSAYIQLQMEMLAGGYKQGLILVASKDIVKAFEDDEYLGKRGNGSLTFYAEVIKPEPEIVEPLIKAWAEAYMLTEQGRVARPLYPQKDTLVHVELNAGHVQPSNIWGGPNQDLTKSFNPCGGCEMREACLSV